MHFIYHLVLLMICYGSLIHCQGARFGGGGGGGVGFTGAASCRTEECKKNESNRFLWFLGCSLLSLLCGLFKCWATSHRNKSLQDHSNFVNVQNIENNKEEAVHVNPFQSGLWSSRYFQDKICYEPPPRYISFDHQSMKVIGTGSDDVGTFTIDGIYSFETNRIGFTKTYQRGTGDIKRNLGHQIIVQLTWNVQNHQFEGKWYIISHNFRAEDIFELKKIDGTPNNV